MKKTAAVFLVCLVFIGMQVVTSIVVIPPLIYFASVSIIGFITNMFLLLAVWLTVIGVTNKSYFGQPFHVLAGFFFKAIGIGMVIIISSLIPILVFRPAFTRDIALSSMFSGILCAALLFLNNYRRFRITQFEDKAKIIRSIAIVSLAAVVRIGE